VDSDGVVCVADFGLARAVDQTSGSRSGDVVGTLRYMAPEQWQGTADARSDIFSLGVTLYELLTLRPAFEESDRSQHLNGPSCIAEPVAPRKIDPGVPRDLETIVLKCLATDAGMRYPTAADVAADLRRFLSDRPIRARRVSAVERTWRWCHRNPALAAMSGLAALLLVAVVVTALAGRVQTRRAYAGAGKAMTQADATYRLALEVLDDIYLQLSPDRIRLVPDSDPGGDALSCVALRSRANVTPVMERASLQVQASNETATLLKDLLVFYDRLAEQVSNDSQVVLESAVASRRVGDIRQHLGQINQAEKEYARATDKLTHLGAPRTANVNVVTELARNHNEIGNVRSARFEFAEAYESHRLALSVLQSCEPSPAEAYRFELARTYYFLSSKPLNGFNSRRWNDPVEDGAGVRSPHYRTSLYRKSAIQLLESLTGENPGVPDYRFLLALCHRPSELGPTPARSEADLHDRQRAIRILAELTERYPTVADYRYELAVSYAWIHTGLYRWERSSAVPAEAESNLLKGLDESRWLAMHHPAIPQYARSRALILAKLATVYWRTGRRAEAEVHFQRALETQRDLLTNFPGLPSHNRVLLEFFRLRLAQAQFEGNAGSSVKNAAGPTRALLTTCITNLTTLLQEPELNEDRLAWNSLPVAYDALSHVLSDLGDAQAAKNAKRSGEAIRNGMSNRIRLYWRY